MNKKNILVFSMALAIVGGATAAVYASEYAVNSTKNNVVTVTNKEGNGTNQTTKNHEVKVANGKISDEEAVKIATKALKDYMGRDAKSSW
ncbi:UNVERIFIED_CONTAM: 20S proteasome alpha/beta subunit [Brevibacillus sp. OAP136]